MSLTTGAVKVLYDEQKGNPLHNNPTVQIINIKAVTVNGGIRHRVIISDGVNFMQAMLAQQHSHLVDQEQIKRHSIITLKEFVCNALQSRKILILLNFEVVQVDVESKIGMPVSLEGSSSSSNPSNTNSPSSASASSPYKQEPKPESRNDYNSTYSSHNAATRALDASATGISNLNPYQTRWHIKARVTQKSEIRKWHNSKSDGQLFSVNLLDSTGEIKATAFTEQVDKFYNLLEEGQVYYISKAQVTMAKKQFSTLNNEYELLLQSGTEIQACGEAADIPQVKYCFVKIADIDNCEKDSNCVDRKAEKLVLDVLGVVTEDAGISEIVSKASGKPMKKRELTLADESLKTIRITLWGAQAEQFDATGTPIIACKGVRVNDYNGRSLSLGAASTFKINPNTPEANHLKQWYTEKGTSANFNSYSGMAGAAGDGITKRNKITLQEAKSENLGMGNKADYFEFRGTVVYIKSESCAYPACPECKKKMILESNGWRCEKCQKTFGSPDYRYILTMSVEDATSQIYCNAFDEPGNTLLKMSANEIMALKESDAAAAQVAFNRALFQTFNFKIRAKQETFNDITRIKYNCIELKPIDYVKESQEIVANIEKLLI
ncbi:replication factor-A protein 1 [Parasitella parasitica]|nr:replication factor-A protein 1 [Parasitella parasitica]